MDMARLLKNTSNVLMGAVLIKLVADDLRSELRRDASLVGERANVLVHRAPYRAAGAAAALGICAGMLLKRR
jgi:ElaB/YqjD/DUF883 family membrane-anchored ribosome-binding protein